MKIFLIGFMGSGKTHWGNIWAKKNGLPFFDLDRIIEEQEKKTIADIFKLQGEDYFREKETVALRAFAEINEGIVACGGGTPCFHDNMQWMNEHGTTVYLNASPQTIYNRVLAEKDKRPLLEKVNKADLLSFIEQKLKEREPFYKQAKIILSAEELTAQTFSLLITHNS